MIEVSIDTTGQFATVRFDDQSYVATLTDLASGLLALTTGTRTLTEIAVKSLGFDPLGLGTEILFTVAMNATAYRGEVFTATLAAGRIRDGGLKLTPALAAVSVSNNSARSASAMMLMGVG